MANATMVTRFTVSPDVCSSSDKDGSTIFSVGKGRLYSTIGVGSLVWTRLTAHSEGLTVEDVVRSIGVDFPDLSQEQIARDVESLLNQLSQKGIIQSNNGKTERIADTAQTWVDTAIEPLARITAQLLLKLKFTSIAAFLELALVDLTLKLGGFRALHGLVKRWPVAYKKDTRTAQIQKVYEAVDQAARRYLKHSRCLQRSAVLTCILRSQGIPAQMVIACRRIPFKGHAWVEVDGKVVNDNPRVQMVCDSVLERC